MIHLDMARFPGLSVLGLLILLAGCDDDSPIEPELVNSVEVLPRSATITVDQTVQFEAVVVGESGDTLADRDVSWESTDTNVATVNGSGMVTGVAEGTSGIIATVEGVESSAGLEVVSQTASLVLPELPREVIRFTPPEVTGNTVNIGPGDDLQQAINNAQPGDEIVLDPDGVWDGRITMPVRDDGGWITIRANVTLPDFGERIGASENLPQIRMVSTIGIDIPANSNGWWFQGIEVIASPGGFSNAVQTTQGTERVVWDRSRVTATPTEEIQLGFRMDGAEIMIIGSRFEGIRRAGFNSRGVEILEGPGPFRIHNNFIEAATINVIVGNANPSVNPADVEFTNNHCYKRPSWQTATDLNIKNLFETKTVERILIEGNIFENNWPDAQQGRGIIFSSRELNNEACPVCAATDHTFRLNKLINQQSVFNIARNPEGDPTPLQRILIEDVIVENWGADSDMFESDGGSTLVLVLRGVDDLTIRRVSAVNSVENQTFINYTEADPDPLGQGIEWTSLEVGPTTFGVRGSAGGPLSQTYQSSPRIFDDIYAVQNADGSCPSSTGDSTFSQEYFCVTGPGAIPAAVGADELAVNNAISGVRDDELAN